MEQCTFKSLESYHPGFTSAYSSLNSLGCDGVLVTTIFKFCIVESNGEPLDSFIKRRKMLASIEAARGLGFSAEEIMATLTGENDVTPNNALPPDLVL